LQAGWLLCTGVKLRVNCSTGAGLMLLDTATMVTWGAGLTILGWHWLRLLDIALEDAVLVSLAWAWALLVGWLRLLM